MHYDEQMFVSFETSSRMPTFKAEFHRSNDSMRRSLSHPLNGSVCDACHFRYCVTSEVRVIEKLSAVKAMQKSKVGDEQCNRDTVKDAIVLYCRVLSLAIG
jgi:hypothetical protein